MLKTVFAFGSCVLLVIFYCEYAIYYLVLIQCKWPSGNDMKLEKPIKVMFLADTHIVGTRRGHWLDKLKREWEMRRAFQTAIYLHKPELIFILGDLFDEGLWSSESDFNTYVDTFKYVFSVPKTIQLYVVVGNHDIGFHYSIMPHLEKRFNKAFGTSPIELVSKRNIHFVLINSMAMEMDGCSLCYRAELKLKHISKRLRCSKKEGMACSKNMMLDGNYSKPILLQHFPLYRKNDMACNEPDSAPLREKEKPFRDGWDSLRKNATKKLLEMIKPRLVFGGHTHYGCYIKYTNEIHEYSISSFNKRNTYYPSYMLALFTENNYLVKTCHLPQERTILFIYITSIIILLFSLRFEVMSKLIYFYNKYYLVNNKHKPMKYSC